MKQKQVKTVSDILQGMLETGTHQSGRRSVLKWSAPLVTAVVLPLHAATSAICTSSPVVTPDVPSKCSGNPPIGQVVFTITAEAGGSDLQILDITDDAPPADQFVLPSLPATVSATQGVKFGWVGPGSDAITCLPVSDITVTVHYTCDGDTNTHTEDFKILELLIALIP